MTDKIIGEANVVTVVSRSAYSGGNRSELIISRAWAMPSMHTFTIEPIAELLNRYGVGVGWFDPFAGDFKRAMARRVRLDGLFICCGWNSNGVGKKYGFRMEEILLVAHGKDHNDTILTVERKIYHQERLPL